MRQGSVFVFVKEKLKYRQIWTKTGHLDQTVRTCRLITVNPCINQFPHNVIFRLVWQRSLLKTLWEEEKLLVQAISPFPTMFSTLSKTEIIVFVAFNLSSANAFNLVWSKILSCGNELRAFSFYLVLYKRTKFETFPIGKQVRTTHLMTLMKGFVIEIYESLVRKL